jgi:5-methylcytosine-specific restriction endonuclease McrA
MNILLWKYCKGCNSWKLKNGFYKRKTAKDGLYGICKNCHNAASRQYHKDNADTILGRMRGRYAANPEQEKGRSKDYRKNNAEKVNKRGRQRYQENADEFREKSSQWRKEHPEKAQEYNRTHRARKKGNGGIITAAEWGDLKKKYSYTCLCCKRQEPEIKLTLDHVLPIAMGGKNVIENAQPLCLSCNCSKQDKHIDYRPIIFYG